MKDYKIYNPDESKYRRVTMPKDTTTWSEIEALVMDKFRLRDPIGLFYRSFRNEFVVDNDENLKYYLKQNTASNILICIKNYIPKLCMGPPYYLRRDYYEPRVDKSNNTVTIKPTSTISDPEEILNPTCVNNNTEISVSRLEQIVDIIDRLELKSHEYTTQNSCTNDEKNDQAKMEEDKAESNSSLSSISSYSPQDQQPGSPSYEVKFYNQEKSDIELYLKFQKKILESLSLMYPNSNLILVAQLVNDQFMAGSSLVFDILYKTIEKLFSDPTISSTSHDSS